MNIISSWSGGKDCTLACYRALNNNHTIRHLLNFITPDDRRCCFHGIDARLLHDQARCIGIPLVQREVGEGMGEYERDFKEAVGALKHDGIQGMVFGDIYLDEHREWVDRVCGEINITPLEPLWNSDPRRLAEEFIDEGFRAVIVSCNEELGKDFVGRVLDREALARLERAGMCPCGEHGEYHTLVTDGPIFSQRITITKAGPVLKDGFWRHWFLDIQEYELEDN